MRARNHGNSKHRKPWFALCFCVAVRRCCIVQRLCAEGRAGGRRRAEAYRLHVSGRAGRHAAGPGGPPRSRLAVPAARRLSQRRARVRGRVEAAAGFHPAETALGYLAHGARQREGRGDADSRARCRSMPTYVPALVGRGQALLELERVPRGAGQLRSRARQGPEAHRPAQPRRGAAIPRHARHAGARQGRGRRAALGCGARRPICRRSRRRRIRRFCIASWRRSSSGPARRPRRSSTIARPWSSIRPMRDRWRRSATILEEPG